MTLKFTKRLAKGHKTQNYSKFTKLDPERQIIFKRPPLNPPSPSPYSRRRPPPYSHCPPPWLHYLVVWLQQPLCPSAQPESSGPRLSTSNEAWLWPPVAVNYWLDPTPAPLVADAAPDSWFLVFWLFLNFCDFLDFSTFRPFLWFFGKNVIFKNFRDNLAIWNSGYRVAQKKILTQIEHAQVINQNPPKGAKLHINDKIISMDSKQLNSMWYNHIVNSKGFEPQTYHQSKHKK